MTQSTPLDPSDGQIPAAVLQHWRRLAPGEVSRIDSGLINDTWLLRCAGRRLVVLQRLHPIFGAEVNLDIAAVTGRLRAAGVATPELIATDTGQLWIERDGRIWRTLTHMPGRSRHRLTTAAEAYQAGRLTGRFHAALAGFDYDYRFRRDNVHDTQRHLQQLAAALEGCKRHPLHADVAAQARPLLDAPLPIADPSTLPARHAHGDLKVSNLLFDEAGHALCLIDLDTLGRMPWPLEMGDALRSWCNPREEDEPRATLEFELLDAALSGYATTSFELSAEEKASLVAGIAQISLELAGRFLADALQESYFGWDPGRYPSRGAHNLARGTAMAQLYFDILQRRSEAEALVRRRLGRGE